MKPKPIETPDDPPQAGNGWMSWLALTCLVVLGIALALWLGFRQPPASAAHELARRFVKDHKVVHEQVGTPVWCDNNAYRVSDPDAEAGILSFGLEVHGSRGSTSVQVRARPKDGNWVLERVALFRRSGSWLILLPDNKAKFRDWRGTWREWSGQEDE